MKANCLAQLTHRNIQRLIIYEQMKLSENMNRPNDLFMSGKGFKTLYKRSLLSCYNEMTIYVKHKDTKITLRNITV